MLSEFDITHPRSLLIHHACGPPNAGPVVKGVVSTRSDTLNKILHMDRLHLAPRNRARHFLIKCLDRPLCLLDLNQLQSPLMDNGSGFLQYVDHAIEQSNQATFQLQLAKLAWYKSYMLFVRDPGSGTRSEDEGFDIFVKTAVPNASRLTTECIQRLTVAGFRYDYFCRHEQNSPNSGHNDGYLFMLPEYISHYHSLAQTLDSLPSRQLRPNNTVAGFQQRPPQPEPTREQAVTYGQQPSRTADPNRRHESTVYKRARSPTPPGSASAHAVDF
ncbi:MAG: hypothetical protein Q9178_002467 [Gyalolechia marmorata]